MVHKLPPPRQPAGQLACASRCYTCVRSATALVVIHDDPVYRWRRIGELLLRRSGDCGNLPVNSTYLRYILRPDQYTLVIVPIALANVLVPAAIQDGTADMACCFSVGIADTA